MDSGSTLLRTFIAIELPSDLRAMLDKLQLQLRTEGIEARYIRSKSIHLTLKFLGETPRSKVESIGGNMQEWVQNITSYFLEPKGIGVFPDIHRPRVLWVGFTLLPPSHFHLVECIENNLVSYGFAREKRPHSAHLTLARFKDMRTNPDLPKIIEHLGDLHYDAFKVSKVVLFSSELTRDGAIYKPLSEALLSKQSGGDDGQ